MTPEVRRTFPPAAFPLLCIAALQVIATVAMFVWNVPLGKTGKFTYLYAQLPLERAIAAFTLVLIGAALLAGLVLVARGDGNRRRWGTLLIGAGCVATAAWTYFAPPSCFEQHVFNLVSPSHDGAFVWEADNTDDVLAYIRDYPAYLQTQKPRWGGTRVISNPPGTMVLAYSTRAVHERWPQLAERLGPELPPEAPRKMAVAVLFSYVLTLLWLLAALAWTAAFSGWLAPVGMAAATFCIVFSPMTVMFTPGKDTAQLLLLGLVAGLWWNAYQRDSLLSAVLAGLALLLSLFFSLVFAWVAIVLFLAALLHAIRNAPAKRTALAKVTGAAAMTLIAGWALLLPAGVNLVEIARAVAAGQAEVTRGPGAMPFAWQSLGIPLFLLFAGPALLFCTGATFWKSQRVDDESSRLGRWLMVTSAIVMLGTVGFTNVETPRLWIPFAALILAGAALQLRAFRTPATQDRNLLIWLIIAQVVVIGVQWTLMDMREAETRLIQIGNDARYWW